MLPNSSFPLAFLAGFVFRAIQYCRDLIKYLYCSALQFFGTKESRIIDDIYSLADSHDTAAALNDLIQHDGVSSWPPTCNHDQNHWPLPLQGYYLTYLELASSLPTSKACLDDDANRVTIDEFRRRMRSLLKRHVDGAAVSELLKAADTDESVLPRDIRNAWYCCIAWCRHAYRLVCLHFLEMSIR